VYVGGIADFGTSVGNKISLYTPTYGLGVLSNAWTAYMPDTAAFYWAKGGTVNGTQIAAMNGGGYLTFLSTGLGDKIRVYDQGAGASYGMGLATSQLVSFIPTGANFFTWASGGGYNGTAILKLDTSAAWIPTNNVIEQRNGTNAQTLRIYGTYTDASNYERLSLSAAGGNPQLAYEAAGTGSPHAMIISNKSANGDLYFGSNNISRWIIVGANGSLWANTDNAYDIGQSGANRPRDLYLGRNLTVASSMGLGGAPGGGIGIFIQGDMGGGAYEYGIAANPTGTSHATSEITGISVQAATAAAAFTVTQLMGVHVQAMPKGAGSTVTNCYGIYIENQTAGSSTNFGLYNAGSAVVNGPSTFLGFFGSGGTTKVTIGGSRGGNAALASLLTNLANYGLITDATTA